MLGGRDGLESDAEVEQLKLLSEIRTFQMPFHAIARGHLAFRRPRHHLWITSSRIPDRSSPATDVLLNHCRRFSAYHHIQCPIDFQPAIGVEGAYSRRSRQSEKRSLIQSLLERCGPAARDIARVALRRGGLPFDNSQLTPLHVLSDKRLCARAKSPPSTRKATTNGWRACRPQG